MATIWTKQELTEQIGLWKEALKRCASGQSYTIGTRTLTRQDIGDIQKMLDYFAGELDALEREGRGPVFVQGRFPRGRCI